MAHPSPAVVNSPAGLVRTQTSGLSTRAKTEHEMTLKSIANPRRGWIPYPPGTLVAGVEIVQTDTDAPRAHAHRYLVRYTCCGKLGHLAHARITERVSHGATCCQVCACHRTLKQINTRRRARPAQPPELDAVRLLALSGPWRVSS